MTSINQRSINFYNLTWLDENTEKSSDNILQMQILTSSQSDDSEKNSKNNENLRIMFDSVTPKNFMNKTNQKDFIFDIEIKKENGGLATISRTYENFLDLHHNLSSAFPYDTLDIFAKIDSNDTTIVELCYSLHAFLNKITKIDKLMFSDVFHGFLYKTIEMKQAKEKMKTI